MESFYQKLIAALPEAVLPQPSSNEIVFIDELDPIRFWNAFIGAYTTARTIVLMDPSWSRDWKIHYKKLCKSLPKATNQRLLIPTSGTTGMPKFCIHTINSIHSAAQAFAERFSSNPYRHCVNVLPQHHVGGLMAVVRSAVLGGKVVFCDYRYLGGMDECFDWQRASISLVPTQLGRLLNSTKGTRQLVNFGIIFIGGAACPKSLMDKCRAAGLNLSPCYGSTETAAMVTLLDPEDFNNGVDSVGEPLPGVEIDISQDGCVEVKTAALLSGYLPQQPGFSNDPFVTNDLGEINSVGQLRIIGRSDRVIITGGKKVVPEMIETTCLESGLVEDVLCYGRPDTDWGMRVNLDFVPSNKEDAVNNRLLNVLKKQLPNYAVPKELNSVARISRNHHWKNSP